MENSHSRWSSFRGLRQGRSLDSENTEEATKKYALAEEELKEASEINPQNPFVLEKSGELIISRKGDPQRAIQRFKDAIHERPDYIVARDSLGHAYEQVGKRDEAKRTYIDALEIQKEIVSHLEDRHRRAVDPPVIARLNVWLQGEQTLLTHLEEDIRETGETSDDKWQNRPH